MDASRLVRLSEPGSLAPKDPGPNDKTDRPRAFELVRSACHSFARRLDADRPTLVLLDANDVGGGVLEALLDLPCPRSTSDASALAQEIRSEARASQAIMLGICMAQPSLEAWENEVEWPGSRNIKEHEFLIRLFASYRLGILIVGLDMQREGGRDVDEVWRTENRQGVRGRVAARIWRALREAGGRPDVPDGWEGKRQGLLGDLSRLYDYAQETLGEDFFARTFEAKIPEGQCRFLRTIARIDQFGKRPVADVAGGIIDDVKDGWNFLAPYEEGSYGLRRDLTAALRGSGDKSRTADARSAAEHLQAYEVFRDCARWLGDGAFPWARERRANPRAGSDAQFRALFIDENLGPDGNDAANLRSRISDVFTLLFGPDGYCIHIIYRPDGALPSDDENERIGDSLAAVDEFFDRTLIDAIHLTNGPKAPTIEGQLHKYDVIFLEVDYKTRFGGPQVVQKLASYLERTAKPERIGDDKTITRIPPLIVLTNQDNFGHVQQCLNLGAHSFVGKERMFQVPSRLKRAIKDMESSIGNGSFPQRERFGRHSNFRSLYAMRPDRGALLRSTNDRLLVAGGWNAPPGDKTWNRREMPAWDTQDREWIRSLPKADLHCHFGTSISLPTIRALALNTCGHLITNRTGAADDITMLPAPVRTLIDDVCRIVLHAASMRGNSGRNRAPAIDYLRARDFVLPRRDKEASIPDDPYGDLVKSLMERQPPVGEHFVVALIVAASAHLHHGSRTALEEAREQWKYFTMLSTWCVPSDTAESPATGDPWFKGFVVRAARLAAEGAEAILDSIGPQVGKIKYLQELLDAVRGPSASLKNCEEFWKAWYESISERLERANNVIGKLMAEALEAEAGFGRLAARGLNDPKGCSWAPSLQELVVLPSEPAPTDQTLLRYLWGTGLLGAEHLQYPENLILAANDLVQQNIGDNVVYTEIRCETPGYTRAGMGAETVTDILCASFDLAEIFQRERNKRSFVRTNILLAAKRHKSNEDAEAVVTLLAGYLKRERRPVAPEDATKVPAWWKPTAVVGFDLSGNEAKRPEFLRRLIGRLAEHSAHITVHAGEAASAESIWQAVYEYHARRIGHGLRLRERKQLLQFCINEGICMEMCPISNRFTSDFVQFEGLDSTLEYEPHRIEHYPLRHFIESGLEVCINTDNRSLHGPYGDTLTDEYLWAARLSRGFSRWEVLKLVKAGFKHAFVDKREVQDLLHAAENWMFALVANPPGLDWQPKDRSNKASHSSP